MCWLLPVQSPATMYVRGCVDTGLIRGEAAALKVLCVGETLVGLKRLTNVSVTIYGEYAGIVASIVQDVIGEASEISALSLIACTLWQTRDCMAHIFFSSNSDRFVIGSVTLNGGQDTTPLYAGYFGGELRLGFALGWTDTPEPEKTEQTAEKAEQTEKPASAAVAKSCWKIEFDLHFLIQHCQKWF